MKDFAMQLSFLPYRYFSGLFRNLNISLPLIFSTFVRLKKPLRWGKDLYPLNYQIIQELLNYSLYQKELQRSLAGPLFYFEQWQLISLANNMERRLLQHSVNLGIPHEVCQIVITTSSGEQIRSAVLHGGLFSFAMEQVVEHFIIRSFSKMAAVEVKKIEIIHTHPSIDFILETTKDESFIYLNGLSRADIAVAQKLSLQFKALIKMKAVTHSELCYSVSFVQGRAIKY